MIPASISHISMIDEIWIGLAILAVSAWAISAAKPHPQRGVWRDSVQLTIFLIAVMVGFGLVDELLRRVLNY